MVLRTGKCNILLSPIGSSTAGVADNPDLETETESKSLKGIITQIDVRRNNLVIRVSWLSKHRIHLDSETEVNRFNQLSHPALLKTGEQVCIRYYESGNRKTAHRVEVTERRAAEQIFNAQQHNGNFTSEFSFSRGSL